jgi:hypothetical protein
VHLVAAGVLVLVSPPHDFHRSLWYHLQIVATHCCCRVSIGSYDVYQMMFFESRSMTPAHASMRCIGAGVYSVHVTVVAASTECCLYYVAVLLTVQFNSG